MIDDARIAELKRNAIDFPRTFHHLVYGQDVLGLITRVEIAEANAQRVAEQHLARANAGGIDVDRPALAASGTESDPLAPCPYCGSQVPQSLLDDGLREMNMERHGFTVSASGTEPNRASCGGV